MGSSRVRKGISRLAALLTVFTLALAIPTFAFAQGRHQPVTGLAGVDAGGRGGGGGGGLAATGFDAWKVGAAGMVCLAAGAVLLGTTRRARNRA